MADRRRPIESSGELSLILTTLPSMVAAESLVRTLLGEGLIACGNLVPGVLSIYRWRGEIQAEEEVLVVLKTASTSVGSVFDRVPELHPYSVPELIELDADRVADAYREWVSSNTKVKE